MSRTAGSASKKLFPGIEDRIYSRWNSDMEGNPNCRLFGGGGGGGSQGRERIKWQLGRLISVLTKQPARI